MRVPERKIFQSALAIAHCAHGAIGQKRKGSEVPYIQHPIRVSELLREHRFRPVVYSAALLHDVVEDTKLTIEGLEMVLSQINPHDAQYTEEIAEICVLVDAVTDRYTGKQSSLPRGNRIALEIKRIISTANPEVFAIKLADIYDNARYPGDLEETFLIRWLIEKSLFLQHVPVSDNIERLHAFVEARLKELDGTYRFTSNPLFDLYQQKFMETGYPE